MECKMSSNIFMKKYLNTSNGTVVVWEPKLTKYAINIDTINTVGHGIFALRLKVRVHNNVTIHVCGFKVNPKIIN
jgi:hypothetical protein